MISLALDSIPVSNLRDKPLFETRPTPTAAVQPDAPDATFLVHPALAQTVGRGWFLMTLRGG
jgi:hypothetical protein